MKARGFEPVQSEPSQSPTSKTEPFECEFAGMRLLVAPGVFEPGPVSRGVVDALNTACAGIAAPTVADVGTGSGAIALAFAHQHPHSTVYALDVSAEAVACAAANAARLDIRNVHALQGSLVDPVRDKLSTFDAICANIPWVPHSIAAVKELLRPDRWRGPRATIVGTDRDGLGLLRQLVRDAEPLLRPTGVIILEMDDWQTDLFAAEYSNQYDVVISPTRHYVTLRRPSASVRPAP
jgi:release factor glutamine methyltransferase